MPTEWIGKTVGQMDIRKKYHINIMAVKRSGKLVLSVSPETDFRQGDTLLVLGTYKDVQKCFRL